MISSLPGKALRMLLESRGLPSDSTCILEAEPGKLDIKKTRTWYSINQFTHWFTRQTSDYDIIIDFCVYSASLATSFQKVQCHHDLIKAHAVR